MPSYYFIVNPTSGRGKGQEFGRRVETKIHATHLSADLEYTTAPGHARELAKTAAKQYDIIVVVGGDGTLQETLNGMYGSNAVLGILPVGSGNDFVRAVSIPTNLEQSFEILLRDQRKFIDLAKMNDLVYHNGVGIGFDAWVVNTSLRVKRLRGNAIYLYAVLSTLKNFKPVPVQIEFNGQSMEQDFFLTTIANGVSLGGGFYLTPDALLDDGMLDLCLIENMPKSSVIKNLMKVYSGRHKEDPRVHLYRASKIRISSEQGMAVHADGELISLNLNEINIEVLPKAVNLIC